MREGMADDPLRSQDKEGRILSGRQKTAGSSHEPAVFLVLRYLHNIERGDFFWKNKCYGAIMWCTTYYGPDSRGASVTYYYKAA